MIKTNLFTRTCKFICVVTVATTLLLSATVEVKAANSIEKIEGDVYYFRDDSNSSIFSVTPEGVILVDPHGQEASQWLKTELMSRFNQKVKYVIYSDFLGYIAGHTDTFADSVIDYYSHLEESESMGIKTYGKTTTITLGGKTVDLIHLSEIGQLSGITAVRFNGEDIVFVGDTITVDPATEYGGNGYTVELANKLAGMAKNLKIVAELGSDYDFATSHSGVADHNTIQQNKAYLTELAEKVADESQATNSRERILGDLIPSDNNQPSGFHDDYLLMNIEEMAHQQGEIQ